MFSIVNPEKKIVGIGYNGFPNGCDDDDLPWARQTSRGDILATKYPVRNERISLMSILTLCSTSVTQK